MSWAADIGMGNGSFAPPCSGSSSSPRFIVAPPTAPVPPTQLFLWTWRALTHLKISRNILSLLSTNPVYSDLLQRNPRFAVKFLTGNYLARDLSTSQSAACFMHHYRRLSQLLPEPVLRQCMREELTLHVFPGQDCRFALTMGLSRPYDNEGELTLRLRVDGDIVFVLAFTLVPGGVVESPAAETLLVTRLQGIKGRYRQIAEATKAMHEVAPGRLLLAALQGVAEAFHIGSIAVVPADRQTAYKPEEAGAFQDAYDNFFSDLGFSTRPSGFLYSALPIAPKPLVSIKRTHRLRAKKKRAFKQAIQQACARFFANPCY